MYDQAGRVFIHPSSVLFSEAGFKSGYLAYFAKAETSKVFLRDATEVSPESIPKCQPTSGTTLRPLALWRANHHQSLGWRYHAWERRARKDACSNQNWSFVFSVEVSLLPLRSGVAVLIKDGCWTPSSLSRLKPLMRLI